MVSFAHHAQVADAVLHVGDDVGGFGQHGLQGAVPHGEDELAALVPQALAVHADLLQQLHGGFFQPALGEGDAKGLHRRASFSFRVTSQAASGPISRVVSPTRRTLGMPISLA